MSCDIFIFVAGWRLFPSRLNQSVFVELSVGFVMKYLFDFFSGILKFLMLVICWESIGFQAAGNISAMMWHPYRVVWGFFRGVEGWVVWSWIMLLRRSAKVRGKLPYSLSLSLRRSLLFVWPLLKTFCNIILSIQKLFRNSSQNLSEFLRNFVDTDFNSSPEIKLYIIDKTNTLV